MHRHLVNIPQHLKTVPPGGVTPLKLPVFRVKLSPEDCVTHTDFVVTLSTAATMCRRLCLRWCTEVAGTSVTTSSWFARNVAATSNWLTATTPTAATTESGSSDVSCRDSRQKVATGCASISETGSPVVRSVRISSRV